MMRMGDNVGRLTYKRAGVNIDAGNQFVRRIGPLVRKTHRPGVLSQIGGYGGLFALGSKKYKSPVLVSSTDGVGTKLKIAFLLDRHDTVGIDLVAMCVNDVAVVGAEPLFFLDYLATSRLQPEKSVKIIEGMVRGCQLAGCSLVAGETAEIPEFYHNEEYDLAGFCVGIAERSSLIDGRKIRSGDQVLGLASAGLHSNGYSLVRKVFFEHSKRSLDAFVPFLGKTLGDELMTPTRIYVKTILKLIKKFPVKGMAHITGGGLTENIPRILSKGYSVRIMRGSWPVPPIFKLLQKEGNISDSEMFRVFNMGIGMVIIASKKAVSGIAGKASALGETVFTIGEVTKGSGCVEYV